MIDFLKSDKFILPIVYIVIGIILLRVVSYVINKISKNKYVDKKKKTIISLIKNIFRYSIYIFVILSILSVYGVDTSGILASLGIAGLVIGLALQDIIADFVAGIFILFDDQYIIGDIVEINGFKGEVIQLTLKSTRLKSATGEVMILANRMITDVINHTIENSLAVVDLEVSYNADLDKTEKILKDACIKLWEDN